MRTLDNGIVYPLTFGSHDANEYLTVFTVKIYSTDNSSVRLTITCYDMDGKIHWRLHNHNEISMMRGFAVDYNSNVCVAGEKSGRIAIISYDGKVLKPFQPEGINCPRKMFYDKRTNKLLICEQNGDAGMYSVC